MTDPFAPPTVAPLPPPVLPTDAEAADGPWRHDDLVIARTGRTWPRRCVRCNDPRVLEPPLTLWMGWSSRWTLPLLLLGALPYVVVYLALRRHGSVRVFLCETHHRERTAFRIGVPAFAVLLSLGCWIVATSQNLPVLCIGAALPLAALFVVPREVVRASWIEGRRIDVIGTGPAFRDALPAWEPHRIDVLDLSDVPDL